MLRVWPGIGPAPSTLALKVGDPFRSVVRSITRKVRVQLGDLPVQAPDASAMQSGHSCIGLHKVKGTRWPPGIYREGGA